MNLKTLFLASITSCAVATPAFAGPDFVAKGPQTTEHAASPGTRPIAPFDDIVFEHDSARLMPVAADQLTTIARYLKKNPKQRLVIEGYADMLGVSVYNEDLATRRAAIVRSHLVSRGVAGDRLVVLAYGEVGADLRPDPLDRRVVVYASDRPIQEIVKKSFDKGALTAMWQTPNALFTERRASAGRSPTRTIVSRR
jgi:outer membrane protein OmpA-like peptidoglycan-associated protein